jgi:hypothetical protein
VASGYDDDCLVAAALATPAKKNQGRHRSSSVKAARSDEESDENLEVKAEVDSDDSDDADKRRPGKKSAKKLAQRGGKKRSASEPARPAKVSRKGGKGCIKCMSTEKDPASSCPLGDELRWNNWQWFPGWAAKPMIGRTCLYKLSFFRPGPLLVVFTV